MGYTTDFEGKLKLNKQLSLDDHTFLKKLSKTRRMARNVDPKYGVEGEFYVDGDGMMGQGHENNIIDYNIPPKTQPGLWCQWTPTDDGEYLVWDGGEKFYNYVEWLEYIINWLAPRGYVLNGSVTWQGEESDDMGRIIVKDNVVTTQEGVVSYQGDIVEIDNNVVWKAINKALTDLGMTHRGGGDGTFGFEDTYVKGDYEVTIGMGN